MAPMKMLCLLQSVIQIKVIKTHSTEKDKLFQNLITFPSGFLKVSYLALFIKK